MKLSENKHDVWVTMEHIRQAGGCAPGARAWFRQYHLNFKSFIKNGGIESETLLKTGDALAIRCVDIAMREQEKKG